MSKSNKPVSKREEMRARAIVQRAMDQRQKSEIDSLRGLIGRCFKYRNSYSSGEQWWLYAVVTGVDEHGRLTVTQMQNDSMGSVSAQPDTYGGLLPQGGWIEIPRAEFLEASVEITYAFLSRVESAKAAVAVARCSGISTV